jgi:excisionase family DNA binding protein
MTALRSINAEYNNITRDTVDMLLDAGSIEVAMSNGRWWRIRRNGATRRWKRDATRIYIPYKAGMYTYGNINEHDFINGVLDANNYRIAR